MLLRPLDADEVFTDGGGEVVRSGTDDVGGAEPHVPDEIAYLTSADNLSRIGIIDRFVKNHATR